MGPADRRAKSKMSGNMVGMNQQLPVCVIGAGVSGLTSIKQLRDRGIDVVCFETGSDVGGIWRYDNDSGRSPAYASLHIDTSKERFAYADHPVPRKWPTYLHHTQVLEYLESYADRFAIRDAIRFRHDVMSVVPDDGGWRVKVCDLDTDEVASQMYRAVVVASGHHWDPNIPKQSGSFSGEIMHARSYRTPDRFIGKHVVVVGLGNTGADIACELSWHAASVTISTRSGAHILPRYILGRPLDRISTRASSRLPLVVQRLAYQALLRIARGSQESYGVPTPDAPILSQHPTVSQDLLGLVKDGQIVVKGDVSRFTDTEVVFANGDSVSADVIIYATGYTITFPFFDESVFSARDNRVDLYKMVVPVDTEGLYFIGLIQPVGAMPPLVEQQARWVAQLLDGAPLPSSGEMRAEVVVDRYTRQKQYLERPRHTIQVDYWPYLDQMRALCDANDAQRSGE